MLDWYELRPDKEHPWDKLCDSLQGAGVPNLDEALVKLKLQPVASALRSVLDPALIRCFAELSELQDVITERDAHVLKSSAVQKKRQEFFETICDRACVFFHQAYRFSQIPGRSLPQLDEPVESEKLAIAMQGHLRKAMRIPQMEDGLFHEQPARWSDEARRVLPSRSPRIDSTAVWAPVLGWLLLKVLAEWIEAGARTEAKPASTEAVGKRAIELFDQLRLRTAFGESFAFIGVEGEDAWRASARIRVAFLPFGPDSHSVAQEETSPWWSDADVRWLTGLHRTKDGWYFNKESYEQMVWWSALPEMQRVDPDASTEKARLRKLGTQIEAELTVAEQSKYRLGGAATLAAEPDAMIPRTKLDRGAKPAEKDLSTSEHEAEPPPSIEVVTGEREAAALPDSSKQ